MIIICIYYVKNNGFKDRWRDRQRWGERISEQVSESVVNSHICTKSSKAKSFIIIIMQIKHIITTTSTPSSSSWSVSLLLFHLLATNFQILFTN